LLLLNSTAALIYRFLAAPIPLTRGSLTAF